MLCGDRVERAVSPQMSSGRNKLCSFCIDIQRRSWHDVRTAGFRNTLLTEPHTALCVCFVVGCADVCKDQKLVAVQNDLD